ncbi:hypothetical protein [Kitasatospora brasiliensis]|uniref:hypothetical protein n=1 Tax=Kitasatospora brasiliensis TaxID=3058040 RepID=UPI00292CE8A5|nr:hypothetical protein [Kitasatospora sp. K002]
MDTIPPDTPLPTEAVRLLEALLRNDDPTHRALLAQLPHLRVTGRCACPCASIDFTPDRAAVAAPGAGNPVAEALIVDADGEPVGGALVFTQDGYLSALEVHTWQDEPITRLPSPERLRQG